MVSPDDDAPAWMHRLSRTLAPHPGRLPRLTLLDFTDALWEWATDDRPSNPLITSKTNLQSVSADLQLLRDDIGPRVADQVDGLLDDLDVALRALGKTTGTECNGADIAARPGHIRAIHALVTELRVILTSTLTIEAAWKDIVDSAADTGNVRRVEVPRTNLLVQILDATLRAAETAHRDPAE